jgi:hypothetical protein
VRQIDAQVGVLEVACILPECLPTGSDNDDHSWLKIVAVENGGAYRGVCGISAGIDDHSRSDEAIGWKCIDAAPASDVVRRSIEVGAAVTPQMQGADLPRRGGNHIDAHLRISRIDRHSFCKRSCQIVDHNVLALSNVRPTLARARNVRYPLTS